MSCPARNAPISCAQSRWYARSAFARIVQIQHQVVVDRAAPLGHAKGREHRAAPGTRIEIRGSNVFAIASNGSPTRQTRSSSGSRW